MSFSVHNFFFSETVSCSCSCLLVMLVCKWKLRLGCYVFNLWWESFCGSVFGSACVAIVICLVFAGNIFGLTSDLRRQFMSFVCVLRLWGFGFWLFKGFWFWRSCSSWRLENNWKHATIENGHRDFSLECKIGIY